MAGLMSALLPCSLGATPPPSPVGIGNWFRTDVWNAPCPIERDADGEPASPPAPEGIMARIAIGQAVDRLPAGQGGPTMTDEEYRGSPPPAQNLDAGRLKAVVGSGKDGGHWLGWRMATLYQTVSVRSATAPQGRVAYVSVGSREDAQGIIHALRVDASAPETSVRPSASISMHCPGMTPEPVVRVWSEDPNVLGRVGVLSCLVGECVLSTLPHGKALVERRIFDNQMRWHVTTEWIDFDAVRQAVSKGKRDDAL